MWYHLHIKVHVWYHCYRPVYLGDRLLPDLQDRVLAMNSILYLFIHSLRSSAKKKEMSLNFSIECDENQLLCLHVQGKHLSICLPCVSPCFGLSTALSNQNCEQSPNTSRTQHGPRKAHEYDQGICRLCLMFCYCYLQNYFNSPMLVHIMHGLLRYVYVKE